MSAALIFMLSAAILLGKCCVLALYYRILGSSRTTRCQIYATLILYLPNVATGIALVVLFAPGPGEIWGSSKLVDTTERRNEWMPLMSAVMSLVADLLILVMPIPVIVRLNMPRRKKGGVLALFLIGSM
jgi:hypothetical protein